MIRENERESVRKRHRQRESERAGRESESSVLQNQQAVAPDKLDMFTVTTVPDKMK